VAFFSFSFFAGQPIFRRLVIALAIALAVSAAAYAALDRMPLDAQNHVPSNVAWTEATLASVASGNGLRGLLLARRCEHCHGSEGFSTSASTPNLAGLDKLVTWKQLEDFRVGKRSSPVMEPVAASLSQRDFADLAVYYSILPPYFDPQDNRSFPQKRPEFARTSLAARLISSGDGARGIPPCSTCHGPVAYHTGAPSLAAQNADYIFDQLEAFADGSRANDINLPMRTIAAQLKADERRTLADYYGSGLGMLPAGATLPH
jgi:cytochrome c553